MCEEQQGGQGLEAQCKQEVAGFENHVGHDKDLGSDFE